MAKNKIKPKKTPPADIAPKIKRFNFTPLYCLGLIIILAGILKILLTSGNTYMLDGSTHTARVNLLIESLKLKEFPLWSNRWYAGTPFMQFYSPLFFYLAAGFNLILDNVQDSVKFLLFLTHMLSGVSAFFLVKAITKNNRSAILGGMAYALAPWHIFQIIHFGRFPVNMIYALFPLPFIFYEYYKQDNRGLLKYILMAGISISLLIYSHYGYTLFACMIFGVYTLADSCDFARPGIDKNKILFLIGTGAVAFLLTLYMIIPVLVEKRFVSELVGMFTRTSFEHESATLSAIIERKGMPDLHRGYLGLSFIILALAGAVFELWRKKFTLPLMFILCAYLVLGSETALYKYIPFIYTQQLTERLVIYLLLFIAILSGVAYSSIENSMKKIFPNAAIAIFPVIFVICYWDVSVVKDLKWSERYGLEGLYQKLILKSEGQEGARCLQLAQEPQPDWMFKGIFPAILVSETKLNDLYGFFYQGAPHAGAYIDKGRDWVMRDLTAQNQIGPSADFLYLMNTKFVLFVNKEGMGHIYDEKTSPIIASTAMEYGEKKSDDLENLITEMGINKDLYTADKLFFASNGAHLEKLKGVGPLEVNLKKYNQNIQNTKILLTANRDCYMQLSHSWYPYLRVTIDGVEREYCPSAMNLIGIYFPKGEHSIEIKPYMSALRRNLLIINSLTYLLTVSLLFFLLIKKPYLPEE